MDSRDSQTQRARSLLSKNSALGKELKSVLKRKPCTDRRAVAMRNAIRDNYHDALFLDYALASRKQVEENLWKTVFYKPIEDYRKTIRKIRAAAGELFHTAARPPPAASNSRFRANRRCVRRAPSGLQVVP